jgi:signal transduction histidine kinase
MNAIFRSPFFRYTSYITAALLLTLCIFPAIARNMFSTGSFMPHATCYLQDRAIIGLHVITDLIIGLSYVSIASTLGYLVCKASKDMPFHWVFLAFGTFIISCGFTHFMEVITVWHPVYWLAGYVKAVTAIASIVTALALFPLVPKVFRAITEMKAAEERRLLIERAHQKLAAAHQDLACQKTELEVANRDLEMFAHSVAHDLRAPARAMAGFSSLLRNEHAAGLNEEGRRLIERIVAGAGKMERLLSDLLEYAKVSRTDVEL